MICRAYPRWTSAAAPRASRWNAAFYSWGSGKNHVEGGTIALASVILHAMGNVAIEAAPIQDTAEAWIFTHSYIDLEGHTSAPRQFLQNKREDVPGKLDKYRKEQIRFGKGQSKAIRNIILRNVPAYLVTKAIEVAKQGARTKMQEYIDKSGIAAAQAFTLAALAKVGVKEEHVLAKMSKAKVEALDLDDLVKLSADFKAINSGNANASELFDLGKPTSSAAVDLKDKLKAQVDKPKAASTDAVAKPSEPTQGTLDGIQVRSGAKPFTWFVNDGVGEYLVQKNDGVYTCNCKPKCTDCAHVEATQRFAVQDI